jgi:hypothetical protein
MHRAHGLGPASRGALGKTRRARKIDSPSGLFAVLNLDCATLILNFPQSGKAWCGAVGFLKKATGANNANNEMSNRSRRGRQIHAGSGGLVAHQTNRDRANVANGQGPSRH